MPGSFIYKIFRFTKISAPECSHSCWYLEHFHFFLCISYNLNSWDSIWWIFVLFVGGSVLRSRQRGLCLGLLVWPFYSHASHRGKSLWGQELMATQSLTPTPYGLFSMYLGAQNFLLNQPQNCCLGEHRNLMAALQEAAACRRWEGNGRPSLKIWAGLTP